MKNTGIQAKLNLSWNIKNTSINATAQHTMAIGLEAFDMDGVLKFSPMVPNMKVSGSLGVHMAMGNFSTRKRA